MVDKIRDLRPEYRWVRYYLPANPYGARIPFRAAETLLYLMKEEAIWDDEFFTEELGLTQDKKAYAQLQEMGYVVASNKKPAWGTSREEWADYFYVTKEGAEFGRWWLDHREAQMEAWLTKFSRRKSKESPAAPPEDSTRKKTAVVPPTVVSIDLAPLVDVLNAVATHLATIADRLAPREVTPTPPPPEPETQSTYFGPGPAKPQGYETK